MPAWLLTIVFAFAFVGLVGGIFWTVNYFSNRGSGSAASVDQPSQRGPVKPHPLAKYLEVAGVRWVGDKDKPTARLLLINHSNADMSNLTIIVTVWGRTVRSEEDAVGTITMKVPSLGPNEAKDLTFPIVTKLKIYELPDWQNVTTEMQITSPPAP